MKRLNLILKTFICSLFIFGLSQSGYSQPDDASHVINFSIPEVAIIDIEGSAGTTIDLTYTAPTNAGNPIIAPADNSELWLNISSIVGTVTARKVTVEISSGAVPAGTELYVIATEAGTGHGDGDKGNQAGTVLIDGTPQDVITGIGSCYTDNGTDNGWNLKYTWQTAPSGAYSDIQDGTIGTVTVMYTIIDDVP